MSKRVPLLGEQADICDVCHVSIADVASPITKDYFGTVISFCSEKCFEEFYKDPEQYAPEEEEDFE